MSTPQTPNLRRIVAALPLLALPGIPAAQVTLETHRITASDVEAGDFFGIDVDLDGDRMLVGSGRADLGGDLASDEGLAYVYEWDGTAWAETAVLSEPTANPASEYGYSVALQGDWAIVGAPSYEVIDDVTGLPLDHSGAAFVYQYDATSTSWSLFATLTAEEPEADQHFGDAVAIDRNRIVVGAPGAEEHHDEELLDGEGPGLVFVFEFDGSSWLLEAELAASDADVGFEFGTSVDIDLSRERIVVGSDHTAGPGAEINAGAVYVFEQVEGAVHGDWTEVAKLYSSNIRAYDHLGEKVALSGDRIIAGARYDDLGLANVNHGRAFIWHLHEGVWEEEAVLIPEDLRAGDLFGSAVDIQGEVAVVGANRHDRPGSGSEADEGAAWVFVYDGTTWVEWEMLAASDAVAGALYGRAAVIDGQRVLVGSAGTVAGQALAGAVYEYGVDSDLGSAEFYNGSDVNPDEFDSLGRPIVGGVWPSEIHTEDFPAAVQTFVVVFAGQLQLTVPQGELLVDPTSSFYALSLVLSGSGHDEHEIAIPNDLSLIGQKAYAQGLVGDGTLTLLNAYDLTLGL